MTYKNVHTLWPSNPTNGKLKKYRKSYVNAPDTPFLFVEAKELEVI